jgi:hypothetical protein
MNVGLVHMLVVATGFAANLKVARGFRVITGILAGEAALAVLKLPYRRALSPRKSEA